MANVKIEIFTRPTWTDCQALKEFLSENKIVYKENDLSKHPDREEDLIKLTGNRIVPGIVIKELAFLGLWKKQKIFIGFEINQNEIKQMILS